jgi:hypothetical protein
MNAPVVPVKTGTHPEKRMDPRFRGDDRTAHASFHTSRATSTTNRNFAACASTARSLP